MLPPNFSRDVFSLVVLFANLLTIEGLIKCQFCDSKDGPCKTDTLEGVKPRTCTRWYQQCSVYRRVLSNGTTAHVVRGCDRDCNEPSMKWTLGRYQKTTLCKYCCSSDMCNAMIGDPCNKSLILMANGMILLPVVVILGILIYPPS